MGPFHYEIVVRGRLGAALANAFDGFEALPQDGDVTRLVGWLPDQVALHACLRRIGDLGLELVEIRSIDDHLDHPPGADVTPRSW